MKEEGAKDPKLLGTILPGSTFVVISRDKSAGERIPSAMILVPYYPQRSFRQHGNYKKSLHT